MSGKGTLALTGSGDLDVPKLAAFATENTGCKFSSYSPI